MQRVRQTALLVAALILAGCATPTEPLSTTESSATPTPSVASSHPATSRSPSTSAPPTTTVAPTVATTTATEPESVVVLEPDGLGVVSFGDTMDDAMAILTGVLGTPTSDEIHTDVMTRFDEADNAITYGYYRRVGWAPVGLYIEFVDWGDGVMQLDEPVFRYWTESGTLQTSEGIGPGTTWADTLAVFGDEANAGSVDLGEASGMCHYFSIRRGGALLYSGYLTDAPSEPGSSLSRMDAGVEAFSQGC